MTPSFPTSRPPVEVSRPSPLPQTGLLCGRWTPHTELCLPINDLGFRQGATAVERLRTYRGNVFQLDAHLNRWANTVDVIGIEGLPLPAAIKVLVRELIGRNETFVKTVGDFGITMIATPGPGRGEPPTFAMHLQPIDHHVNQIRRDNGQPIVVTAVAPPGSESWPRSIKVRCRLHYYLADQIARLQGEDAIGLLVDPDGIVTETSIANVAIVEKGNVVAAPRNRVLGGITQAAVHGIAKKNSVPWSESPIDVARLKAADEILLMGTDGGLWFAGQVDGRLVGDGKPGKVYRHLLTSFDELTSR